MRTRLRAVALSLALLAAFFIPAQPAKAGLDLLGIGKLADTLDEAIKALVQTLEKAGIESEEWRGLFDTTRKDLKDLPGDLGVIPLFTLDVTISRVKENIDTMYKIKALLDEGKRVEGVLTLIEFQKALTSKRPPRVGPVSLKAIEHKWLDHTTYQRKDSQQNILYTGVDFDPNDKSRLRLEIQDAAGKGLRTVSEHLVIISAYQAQVDISAGGSGIKFQPEERRLVLLYDGKAITTVMIQWDPKPELVVKPPARTGPPEFGGGGARR